jgi:hypothetical protein
VADGKRERYGLTMSDDTDLVKELRTEVKGKRRGALLDAYIKKPTAEAIATKALEILMEEIDAIDKP